MKVKGFILSLLKKLMKLNFNKNQFMEYVEEYGAYKNPYILKLKGECNIHIFVTCKSLESKNLKTSKYKYN